MQISKKWILNEMIQIAMCNANVNLFYQDLKREKELELKRERFPLVLRVSGSQTTIQWKCF